MWEEALSFFFGLNIFLVLFPISPILSLSFFSFLSSHSLRLIKSMWAPVTMPLHGTVGYFHESLWLPIMNWFSRSLPVQQLFLGHITGTDPPSLAACSSYILIQQLILVHIFRIDGASHYELASHSTTAYDFHQIDEVLFRLKAANELGMIRSSGQREKNET